MKIAKIESETLFFFIKLIFLVISPSRKLNSMNNIKKNEIAAVEMGIENPNKMKIIS